MFSPPCCRDEVNRLIEIINSRAIDPPEVERESKSISLTVGDLRRSTVALGFSGKSAEEKQEDLNRAIGGTSKIRERKYSNTISVDSREPANALENSRHIEEKHEELDRSPLLQLKVSEIINVCFTF